MQRLTLKQLARKTRISESTLRGYLRTEGARIPFEGEGRNRRYPESAVAVVRTIKQENLRRKQKRRSGYYTLRDIYTITGISQTTLTKYQKTYGHEIPSEGEGRKRIYPKEAIRLFRFYRKTSRRGPVGAATLTRDTRNEGLAGLARRMEALEKQQRRTNKLLNQLRKEKKKPLTIRVIRS